MIDSAINQGQGEAHNVDDVVKELEAKLRQDNEFLNKKINDIIETNPDPKVISDLFELAALGMRFVDDVILKKERSSILGDKLGDVWENMSFMDMIKNQVDKDFYIRTIQTVQS